MPATAISVSLMVILRKRTHRKAICLLSQIRKSTLPVQVRLELIKLSRW